MQREPGARDVAITFAHAREPITPEHPCLILYTCNTHVAVEPSTSVLHHATDLSLRPLFLPHRSSLTSVDLSHNHISDAGLEALVSALQVADVAPCLLELSLLGNPLTAAGCSACSAALRSTFVQIRLELPAELESSPTTATTSITANTTTTSAAATATTTISTEAESAEEQAAEPGGVELQRAMDTLCEWACSHSRNGAKVAKAMSTLACAAEAEQRRGIQSERGSVVLWTSEHLQEVGSALYALEPTDPRHSRAPEHILSATRLLTALVSCEHADVLTALSAHRVALPSFERRQHRGGGSRRAAQDGAPMVGLLNGCVPLMIAYEGSPALQKVRSPPAL